jgi:hypothetical protein
VAGLFSKKVAFWIWLISLLLVAGCSTTQPWVKGKPVTQMTPAEQEEYNPEFWRMWQDRRGLSP